MDISWIWLVILAAFLGALSNIVNKYAISNKTKSGFAYFTLWSIIIAIVLSIVLVAQGWITPPDSLLLPIFASSVFMFIGTALIYYGLSRYDVSSALPIVDAGPIFAVPLGMIFLGEFYGLGVIFGIVLVALGAVLVSWTERTKLRQLVSPSNKALWIFLAAALLWVITDTIGKPIIQQMGSLPFLTWKMILCLPILALTLPFLLKGNTKDMLKTNWKRTLPFAAIATSLMAAAWCLFLYGVGKSLQIATAANSSRAVFIVILVFLMSKIARMKIDEPHILKLYLIRLIGAISVASGILVITFSA